MHVRRGLRGALPLRGGPRGGHGKAAVQRGGGHDTGEKRRRRRKRLVVFIVSWYSSHMYAFLVVPLCTAQSAPYPVVTFLYNNFATMYVTVAFIVACDQGGD